MEITREEMLELAKHETFHLDDMLCPLSREQLRAESWLRGYEFALKYKSLKLDENIAFAIYNFVNEWKSGKYGIVSLSEAIDVHFDPSNYTSINEEIVKEEC